MSLPHEQSAKSGVTPVETAPLQPGASSHRESSIMYRQEQVAKQQSMNKQYSGGKRRRCKMCKKTKKCKKCRKSRKSRKSRKHRGGSSDGVVVPSFSTPGPAVSAGWSFPSCS